MAASTGSTAAAGKVTGGLDTATSDGRAAAQGKLTAARGRLTAAQGNLARPPGKLAAAPNAITATSGQLTATQGSVTAAEATRQRPASRIALPRDIDVVQVRLGNRSVQLTNLRKIFWADSRITKGDLLQYYLDVAPALLPHIRDRAMVMKRYPHGADGAFFFMKRAPSPRPPWIETCAIEHASGNVIDFPIVQDELSLLWVINLGCIDLNPWYARCDDVDRPDFLHFDLDPVGSEPFARVREAALLVRDALAGLSIPSFPKTTGSRGIHVYVPIERGPLQKDVWTFAKKFSIAVAAARPAVLTAEYRVSRRPAGRILVDYNQNAWGRTLASVYSPRPRPRAPVSTPVTWEEVERGIAIEDFRLDNVRERIAEVGDLWAPVVAKKGRVKLEKFL